MVGNQGGTDAEETLDPYECITKRNMKYAMECTEVYLSKKGATRLSDRFRDFENLEVVWFNGNRLARLENLEKNFRVKEVYVQDNRLVSLSGLTSFKFLRVLLASNNQLRNLEKQIDLLLKFNFLKKLDLFGNPVAEEPDYRLQLIYHVPQVETLDRRVVRDTERIKAEEVIPNLDKASPPKPEKARARLRKRVMGETMPAPGLASAPTLVPMHEHYRRGCLNSEKLMHREFWGNPRARAERELNLPTPYERNLEMRPYIQKVAQKQELSQGDVASLVRSLATEGIHHVGRVLHEPLAPAGPAHDAMNASALWKDLTGHIQSSVDSSKKVAMLVKEAAPKEKEFKEKELKRIADMEAQLNKMAAASKAKAEALERGEEPPPEEGCVSIQQVADWLLTKPWPRIDDVVLDSRIQQYQTEQKWSHLGRNCDTLENCVKDPTTDDDIRKTRACISKLAVPAALRLEGIKSSRHEVQLLTSAPDNSTLRKPRADIFMQSMLRPSRTIHEGRGRTAVMVSREHRHTSFGG